METYLSISSCHFECMLLVLQNVSCTICCTANVHCVMPRLEINLILSFTDGCILKLHISSTISSLATNIASVLVDSSLTLYIARYRVRSKQTKCTNWSNAGAMSGYCRRQCHNFKPTPTPMPCVYQDGFYDNRNLLRDVF